MKKMVFAVGALSLVFTACGDETESGSDENLSVGGTSQEEDSGGVSGQDEDSGDEGGGGGDGGGETEGEGESEGAGEGEAGEGGDSEGGDGETGDGETGDTEVGDACAVAGDLSGSATVGSYAPKYATFDYQGEAFDLCDLGGDKPLLIDISTIWCEPCQEFAHFIATGESPDWSAWIPMEIKDAVDNGDIILVEFLVEDNDGNAPSAEALKGWHDKYPHENVIVASDGGGKLASHCGIPGYPDLSVIGADYKWLQTKSPSEFIDTSAEMTWEVLKAALGS